MYRKCAAIWNIIAACRVTLDHLRRYAIARSLFKPTTLKRAIDKLGFVQADPIRAPARAQDLTLRHRVRRLSGRRPGAPLSAAAARGGLLRQLRLSAARQSSIDASANGAHACGRAARAAQAAAVLAFVRARGSAHPREVDAHFAHGKVKNWFGGSSNASTELLDVMHYRGLLRVARREGGTRVYAARAPRCRRSRRGDPPDSGAGEFTHGCAGGPDRAQVRAPAGGHPGPTRQPSARRRAAVDGASRGGTCPRQAASRPCAYRKASIGTGRPMDRPASVRWRPDEGVRLLTPFDPIVWDRRRFEIFWDWAYRFEAYTPAAEAQARLLRAAPALARARDRLGQRRRRRRAGSVVRSATSAAAHRAVPRFAPVSKRNWRGCATFSARRSEAPAASRGRRGSRR